ncbi:MAG: decarboxylating 6-phosphogluconate dehydrogenase [Nanoarchaeota archaeon]|nr:decarboxylating 6-phosphogluconate dehydrogenase [Nanoarchaeota archaeon]
MVKQVGIIGLGKMGFNLSLNLIDNDYSLVAYNRSIEKTKQLAKKGASPAFSIQDLAQKLASPKIILLMLTAGKPVEETIASLIPHLKKGDILIDGGNSYFKDSIARYNLLKKKGIDFLDMGTSGGTEGARHGTSLTIGGEKEIFKKIEFLFRDISVKDGYVYLGKSGAGHYAKMIHNAIEYSMLESYSEGFEVLEKSPYDFNFKEIAKVWNNGSIIRSHILSLIENVFTKNPELKNIDGIIGGGETGTWAYKTALSQKVEFNTLKHSLQKRKSSEKNQSFSTKLISALRNEFGGHEIKKK